jgi:hypothetical protein
MMKAFKYLLLIVFVTSLSSCKFIKKQKLFSKGVDTLLTQPVGVVETAPMADTQEIVQIVQEMEPVKIVNETGVGYTSDSYYMVVGSFLSEKLAMKYAKTILNMGYQPQVIYSASTGFYRVSAKSYTDFKTAINDIANFRSTVTNRAWVHVKR